VPDLVDAELAETQFRQAEETLPEPREVWRGKASARLPKALRLGSEGLTEVLRGGERTTPWRLVQSVVWQHDHAIVNLNGRQLRVGVHFADWQELVHDIEAWAPHAAQPRGDGQVDAESIAEWLGIPVDGELVCRMGLSRGWLWAAAVACLGLLILIGIAAEGNIGAFVQVPIMVFIMLACAESVRADVHGVSLRVKGKPQRYAWSEIESCVSDGYRWTCKTARGSFSISTSIRNAKPLIKALQQVVAARNAGFELPDEVPMPEGALSRLSGGSAPEAVERGLSRAAE
jgi:hypothetical protein